ncbi:MAG: peptidoglycan-binding protein, partial [Rhodospirillales bacterium]
MMPSGLPSLPLRAAIIVIAGLLSAGQAGANSSVETALASLRGFTPETVEAVAGFYRTRGLTTVWLSDDGPDEKAAAVIERLHRAELEGLRPDDYRVSPPDMTTEETRALFDVTLSAKVLRYVTDLRAGRVAPSKADPELFAFTRDIDGVATLSRIADSPRPAATVAEFAPSGELYIRMRRLLAEQRALAASGGWQPVADGPTLKPGMTDPRISAVRARLAASFDKTRPGTAGDLYDPELEVAVRQFQRRHGLTADGAIGAGTLKALN